MNRHAVELKSFFGAGRSGHASQSVVNRAPGLAKQGVARHP